MTSMNVTDTENISCTVPGCTHKEGGISQIPSRSFLSFYALPKSDPYMRLEWLRAIGLPN